MMSTEKSAPRQLQPLTSAEKGKVMVGLQAAKPNLSIKELAELAGISPSYASKLLKRARSADAGTSAAG